MSVSDYKYLSSLRKAMTFCLFGGAIALSGGAAAGVSEADGVLTFDTSDGNISYSQALGASVRQVVKTGDGTLTLDTPSPDFPAASTVEVRQGTLKVCHADVFGRSAGVSSGLGAAITVKEGATLLLNIPTRAADNPVTTYPLFANHPITVGGSGVGGNGAIRFDPTGSTLCDGLLGPLTLTSDTWISNTVRMGFVPHESVAGAESKPFDLGGFTLTLDGSQGVFFHNLTLRNGNIRVNEKSQLCLEAGGNFLDADKPGEIRLNGGQLRLYSIPSQADWGKNWKIVFEKSSLLAGDKASNGFAGDVELAGYENTFDVAENGRLTFTGGTYGGRATFAGLANNPRTGVVEFRNAVVSNDVLISRGVGMTFDGGTLDVDQFDVGTQGNFLNGATNVFCGGVQVNVRKKETFFWNVQSVNQLGALVFSNCTVRAGGSTEKQIRLAIDHVDSKGLVRIGDGASVDLSIGAVGQRGRGLVVQDGGVVTNRRDAVEVGGISQTPDRKTVCKGRGSYALKGGEWVFARGRLSLGANRGGRGWLVQTGGRLVYAPESSPLLSLRTVGYGEYALLGGEFVSEHPTELQLSASGVESEIIDGTSAGVLTLAGEGTRFATKGWLATYSTNTAETVVNLRAGATLSAQAFKCRTVAGAADDAYPGAKVFVNLDGGVIRPAGGVSLDAAFFNYSRKPNAVTLYDGGVVFDTSDRTLTDGTRPDATLGAPLRKATGKGLATVSLPTDAAFAREKYLSPARVHIRSTASGRLATALATFDGDALELTGITVTSPGCDYDEATTAVEIESATNNNVRFACAFTLKANAGTGGVTKRGAGRWVLDAADEFGGDVTVEGGELRLPDGASLAGRKIRLTCAALFGDGLVSCDGTLDVTGAVLEIVDPANLPDYAGHRRGTFLSASSLVGRLALAADYGNFTLTQAGGRCRFGFARGMAIVIR